MSNIIIYFILACIMQLTVVLGFKLISDFNKKINLKFIFLIIPFGLIMTVENYYNLSILNMITSLITYFILYHLIYRCEIKETIFYGSVICLIGMLIDILVMTLSTVIPFYLLDLDIATIRYIDTIFMQIIMLLIFNSKYLKKGLKKIYNSIKKIKYPYLSYLLVMIVLISMGLTTLNIIQKYSFESISISYLILILSLIILIISFLYHEFNNIQLKIINANLIKNNEFYLNVVADYRILKHNIIHQLNGVKSVANSKAQVLIEDLINEYNSNFKNVQLVTKMPIGISGIVYEKIYKFDCKEIRLGIDNYIESDIFENLTPRSYNLLCEALGILLDNALESSQKSKEKIVMIDMKETEEFYQIKVINTFKEMLDIDKIGTMKYTTKLNGHGVGLFSLIGRKKLKIKTSIINDLFFNEILIEKK
ncbi:MAG: ATP-binding protein [Bacilli bacterium]|nr:ATP-binding protein [Bacilli bacterium]